MKIEKLTNTISLLRSVEQANADHLTTVREVITDVRKNGDLALFTLYRKMGWRKTHITQSNQRRDGRSVC